MESCSRQYHGYTIGPLALVPPTVCDVIPRVRTRRKTNNPIRKFSPDLRVRMNVDVNADEYFFADSPFRSC